MKIIVDGQEYRLESEAPQNLSEIIHHLIAKAGSENRVVVGMVLDGKDLQGFSPSDLEKMDTTFAGSLEITTRSVESVSRNILRECADGIPRLIEGFAEATRHIQAGRQKEGMDQAGRALAFWIELVQGVQSALRGLGVDLATEPIPVQVENETRELPAHEVIEKINLLLEETQRAFESEDNLEIGDILEYDLPPLLRNFQEALYLLVEEKSGEGHQTRGEEDS